MSIFRVAKTGNFTVLLNETLRDGRLSLEAVGLLVRLLSRPQDWQVHFEALRRESRVGRDKLRRILRELGHAGYLVRRRIHREDGRFVWISEIHEKPQTMDAKAAGGKTIDGKAADGKPTDIQIKDRQNTEQQKETTTKAPGEQIPDLVMPTGMTATEIERAHRILEPVKEDAQMLLDVLHAAICAGDIRKSRLAYLRALVRRFRKNDFDPTPGLHIADTRKRDRQHQQAEKNLSTEKILREHARIMGKNEDDYLRECLGSKIQSGHTSLAACQGGRP
ncbi:MAG TPA: hypothetical protein ENJ35_11075 [Gammaproteobacteria bacterium]|nr:hypothetical protein [Gammaproteobacteria bacterium]